MAFWKRRLWLRGQGEKQRNIRDEEEGYLQEFGVTEQLCNFVKGFSVDTFKTFPLQGFHLRFFPPLFPFPSEEFVILISILLIELQMIGLRILLMGPLHQRRLMSGMTSRSGRRGMLPWFSPKLRSVV